MNAPAAEQGGVSVKAMKRRKRRGINPRQPLVD